MYSMSKMLVIIFLVGAVSALLFVYIYFEFIDPEPTLIDPSAILEDVILQPKDALKLSQPYIEEKATYVWKKENELQTYIIRHKTLFSDNYYIKRHNYPAKTFRYNMYGAIKINTKTSEISFVSE